MVKSYRLSEVFFAIDAERNKFINIMKKYYIRIAKVFYDRFISEMNKSVIPHKVKGIFEEFWRELENYIGKTALVKVQWIDMATKNKFRIIINKGLEAGKSNEEIAKSLRKVGRIQKKWRARRIARTETHSTAVHSLQEAAKSSRIIQEKEWLSAKDSRTRTSPFDHILANGEKVRLEDYYNKTGEKLLYPGDYQNGSPGNIINCRCVELYHTNRTDRKEDTLWDMNI